MSLDPACWSAPGVARFLLAPGTVEGACAAVLSAPFDTLPAAFSPAHARAFGLTLVLEAPFFAAALRARAPAARAGGWLAANALSHPAVFFGMPALSLATGWGYAAVIGAGEVLAPSAEALLLWGVYGVAPGRAAGWMLAANVFSWWVGGRLL